MRAGRKDYHNPSNRVCRNQALSPLIKSPDEYLPQDTQQEQSSTKREILGWCISSWVRLCHGVWHQLGTKSGRESDSTHSVCSMRPAVYKFKIAQPQIPQTRNAPDPILPSTPGILSATGPIYNGSHSVDHLSRRFIAIIVL